MAGGSDPSAAYPGGFIAHYLWEIVYWDVPQSRLNLAAGFWFVLWTGVYAWLLRRDRAAD